MKRLKFSRSIIIVGCSLAITWSAYRWFDAPTPKLPAHPNIEGVAQLTQSKTKENLTHVTVFTKRVDGYNTYRIPSVTEAKDGTLIAIVEGRRDRGSDPGLDHIDLVYRLSNDGGKSWSPLRILAKSEEGAGASNATTVVEKSSGRIWAFYNSWAPGRGSKTSRPGTLDNRLMKCFSDDNGRSWSDAVDITHAARDVERWGNAVFGPGDGIEMKSGRLVVPVNAPGKFDDDPLKTASYVIYSDDRGETWRRGEQINAYTTENQIVELNDGRLMIDARQKDDIKKRWVAISKDQGQTWGEPRHGTIEVTDVCTSLLRYPATKDNLILWSGPKGPGRSNLVLRLSMDQGLSFPGELMIKEGPAAYSNMTLVGKDVGILWEGGKEHRYESVFFTRVPVKVIKKMATNAAVN